jgi:hypothetical protein
MLEAIIGAVVATSILILVGYLTATARELKTMTRLYREVNQTNVLLAQQVAQAEIREQNFRDKPVVIHLTNEQTHALAHTIIEAIEKEKASWKN